MWASGVRPTAYIYQGGVTYLHVKPAAEYATPAPFPADIPALPSAESPAWPHVSWRGPAPALPPASVEPRSPISSDTEPLPRIPLPVESPPQPAQVRPEPKAARAADVPLAFTLALGSPRNDLDAK